MTAEEILDEAEQSILTGQPFVYEGRTYSPVETAKLLDKLRKQVADEAAAAAAARGASAAEQNRIRKQKGQTREALYFAKRDRFDAERKADAAARGLIDGSVSEQEYSAAFALVERITRDIQAIEQGAAAVYVKGDGPVRYRLVEAPSAPVERQRPPVVPPRAAGPTVTGPSPIERAARSGTTQTPAADAGGMVEDRLGRTQATVTASPWTGGAVTPSADGTSPPPPPPAGGGPSVGGVPSAGGRPAAGRRPRREVTMDRLSEVVDQFFPGYTAEWLSENGAAHFGQDLIDLFRKVAAPGSVYDLTTEAGQARVRREIRKTNYWQTTLVAAKNFDQMLEVDRANTIERTKQRLAETYGDIGLDQDTLNELAQVVARSGLTGLGERQAVYNTVFRVRAERPEQAQRTLQGADADRLRALGKAYNFRVSDDQIQSILTGTPEAVTGLVLTEAGLRERLQKYVKGSMPQLAEQIDAGLTLEDIGANYRRYAANLLEQSEKQIDMFSNPYLEAFGNREQGQLSLGEWTQKLKSDPRFGWQFTNQANRQAGDIALSIARAFGKVR